MPSLSLRRHKKPRDQHDLHQQQQEQQEARTSVGEKALRRVSALISPRRSVSTADQSLRKKSGRSLNSPAVDSAQHESASPLPNGGLPKKRIILNAFVESCSGHQSPGLWRHPEDRSSNFNSLKHWTDFAQLLERSKWHGIFIADVLGGYDVYGGPNNLVPAIQSGAQWPVNDPMAIVTPMAAVTSSIGFGVTVSTSYEQPYHLARRLSTADHLTDGRVAWNVVTGYLDSAARNLSNGGPQADHDERYLQCEEYMRVTYKLWNSSWRSDAVQLNSKTNVYTDPSLVREIHHKGKYFTVPGPHFCQPSPQRTPVIMQAGTSKAGKAFAAKHAELIFVSSHSTVGVSKAVSDIRSAAAAQGRDPSSIKVLNKFTPVLGRTQAEAEAKFEDLKRYGDHEGALALFGGWTGVDMAPYADDEELRYVETNAVRSYIENLIANPPAGVYAGQKWTKKTLAEYICVGGLGSKCIGTPEVVADEMERWIEEGGIDGFNIAYALFPGTFQDVIDLLIPELRRRGLFWADYFVPGGTYRENLYESEGQHGPPSDHPAAKTIWTPEFDPLGDVKEDTRDVDVGEGANGGVQTPQAAELEEEEEDFIDPLAFQLG